MTLPTTHFWTWQNFSIRYQTTGTQGPPLLLIHGFGAHSDHWRKNLPDLGRSHRVYAIDLIGYGQSAKPTPGAPINYTFETWGQQVIDFCREIIGEPVFFVGNSIGCIVAMQAATMAPSQVLGLVVLDCSLRLLHDRKRATLPWYRSAPTPLIQAILNYKPIGKFFFSRLAKPKTLKNILRQAYGRKEAVTNELIDLLLTPARDPAAVDVFVAFISYSQGPLPEDLLPQLSCPVLMLWGDADPWEPIQLGRELSKYEVVEQFMPLEGVGHCPQDEAPELVNSLITEWVQRKAATSLIES
ncbi:putative hydrolase or acyltransferase of alpha/beta superfamily [Leptolyngbya sp. PCC 7375]|nr:putative hydrolase or acyltransferase of alpha/beta superfamily [Leptolyngbya sp. PCC 7375]